MNGTDLESERLIVAWQTNLRAQKWPEAMIKQIIADLCEAGYRQCVVDIQAKHNRNNELIQRAVN